jgi:hypothetical protein
MIKNKPEREMQTGTRGILKNMSGMLAEVIEEQKH